MTPTRLACDDSGFTLIEVLIAIAIFSIGLMAMGALQARSLMATGDVARKTEAWTIVDEQVALLKQLPFYDDVSAQSFPADLVDDGNWHTVNRLDGRYTVHWLVTDDQPIGQQDETVLPGVPVGDYTVSKTITVVATQAGGNPAADDLAQVQFVKTWAASGIP
jgi:prepilin-type N-terminal cleavage/methylation domain-containing protein